VEEAANLAGVPNLSQKGTRVGNWLTREQAKNSSRSLTAPRSKGSGTYAIFGVAAGLRSAAAGGVH